MCNFCRQILGFDFVYHFTVTARANTNAEESKAEGGFVPRNLEVTHI